MSKTSHLANGHVKLWEVFREGQGVGQRVLYENLPAAAVHKVWLPAQLTCAQSAETRLFQYVNGNTGAMIAAANASEQREIKSWEHTNCKVPSTHALQITQTYTAHICVQLLCVLDLW